MKIKANIFKVILNYLNLLSLKDYNLRITESTEINKGYALIMGRYAQRGSFKKSVSGTGR